MSKLLQILEWVPLPQAARHLSTVLSEEVSEADILRLSIDGHMTLSFNCVNHARARRAKVVPLSEARIAPGLPVPGVEPHDVVLGYVLPDMKHVLELEKNVVVTISDVWDLPMIGSEAIAAESRYQELTGGPEVALVSLDGAFLRSPEGEYVQVQAHFENNPHFKKENLRKPWSHNENFYPGGLPDDGAFVIRTRELADFLDRATNAQSGNQKAGQVSTRERDTLLKLIIGMAIGGYGYVPSAAKNKAPAEIAADLARLGLEVSDDTVRAKLKEALALVPSGANTQSR